MVVIRCTQKLLRRINPLKVENVASTTRLGDWSANLIGVRHRRYVLLVCEHARLPVLLPARDVKCIGEHLRDTLARVLPSLGVSALSVRRELMEMRETAIARTNSRSVLGSINDFAKAIKWRLDAEPDADLVAIALWLSETPILPFDGKSADLLTRNLLD